MIDLSQLTIPAWVNWIAQDFDGMVWGYEAEPLQHTRGWYENEVGRYIKLQVHVKNHNWRNSLQRYPVLNHGIVI